MSTSIVWNNERKGVDNRNMYSSSLRSYTDKNTHRRWHPAGPERLADLTTDTGIADVNVEDHAPNRIPS